MPEFIHVTRIVPTPKPTSKVGFRHSRGLKLRFQASRADLHRVRDSEGQPETSLLNDIIFSLFDVSALAVRLVRSPDQNSACDASRYPSPPRLRPLSRPAPMLRLDTPHPRRRPYAPPARFLAPVALGMLLCATASSGAVPRSNFHTQRITSVDGLAQSSVYALMQDRRGFVWLGSQDGLQRYDGYRFIVHRPDPFSPESLTHGLVQTLLQDSDGSVWIGTFDGLSRLDLSTSTFETYGERETGWNVTSAVEDGRGFLYFGTLGSGLVKIPPERQNETVFSTLSRPALPSNRIQCLFLDDEDRLWIGFKDAGVGRMSPSGTFEHLVPGGSPTRRSVKALAPDGDGGVWIGYEGGGLVHWRGPSRRVRTFVHDPTNPSSLIEDHVEALLVDREERLWVGTRGGLDLLHQDGEGGNGFEHFRHQAHDPNSLANNHVRTLMEDRSGLIWVGSAVGGITVVNTHSRFTTVRHDSIAKAEESLPSDVVRSFLEDSSGQLWVATDGGGLVRRTETGFIRPGAGDGAFPEPRVWSLLEDRERALWIGGDQALYRWTGGILDTFRHDPGNSGSIGPSSVRSIVEDEAGRLWIAHFGGGLSRLADDAERFEHFRHDPDTPFNLVSDLALYLFLDTRNQLWIGTAEGLSRRTADGRFHTYRHDGNDRTSLLGDIVRHIYQDRSGNLWVGTDAGLNRLPADRVFAPPATSTNNRGFTHYSEVDGLPNNTVYAIQEDSEGRLWLSTNRGLARFDPVHETFDSFDLHDGLQDSEFNGAAVLQGSDGRLYFGGVRGYNVFYPQDIRSNPFEPPVVFTRLTTLKGSVNLEEPVWSAKRLTVPHDEPYVSLEFAALDYTHSAANRYAYRLDGIDEEWRDLGTKSSLTLTHLDPGTYTLRVRGSNSDGVWNEEGTSVELVIEAPPWLSRGARLAYGLAGLAVAFVFWRRRRRRHLAEVEVTERIRASERRMNLALIGSGDAVWDWDLETDEIFRAHLAEMLGYAPGELPPEEDLREDLVHPDDLALVERAMDSLLQSDAEDRFEIEYRMRDRSGAWRWILDRGKIVSRDELGRPLRIAGTFKDISTRKKLEGELKLWSTVFESVDEGVAVLDPSGKVETVNPALCDMTGRPREEWIGRPLTELVDPKHSSLYRRIRHAVTGRGAWEGEVPHGPEGNRVAGVSFKSVLDARRRVSHFVVVASDITDRKVAEEELLYLANYDVLTGLPNRSHFQRALDAALESAGARQGRIALLFGDLDQFKQVNDTLGHAVGDLLLQEAAARISSSVRQNDFVARLGGDELIVLIEDVDDEAAVLIVAERILAAFAAPFELESHELSISTSLGISIFPNDGEDALTLLKHADTAMYEAKAAGRNRFSFYDQNMSRRALARMSLDNRLRHAVQEDELVLYFQPKLDLETSEIHGVEAMIRWPQPDGSTLTPGDFLGVAEETGLILPIGLQVIEKACRQAVEWSEKGIDLEVSVNVSATLLGHQEFIQELRTILRNTGMQPTGLTLELTEDIVMDASESNQFVLHQLKDLEVRLSLDDFGTGYSSLGQLRDLPIDELKIDGSFVQAIAEQATVPRTILAMAEGLGLEVVAEGVETEEQLRALQHEGCRRVQGFVISVPLAAPQLEDYLRSPEPPWSALLKPRERRSGKRRRLRAVD